MSKQISLSFLTSSNCAAIVDGVEKIVSGEDLIDLVHAGATERVGVPLRITHVGAYYYGALTFMGKHGIDLSPTDKVLLTSRDNIISTLGKYGRTYRTEFSYMAILTESMEMGMLLTEDSGWRSHYVCMPMDAIQHAAPCSALPFINYSVENKWHNKPTIL